MSVRKVYLSEAALQHNLQQVKQFAPNSKVLAMIKAHGYGHGLLFAASALAGFSDAFGVGAIDEAKELRDAGFLQPILLMSGCSDFQGLQWAQQHHVGVVVHSLEQIAQIEKLKSTRKLWVWIKVDTGMHRLGVAPNEVEKVWQTLNNLDVVQKPITIMSHFADASELQKITTAQQIQLFSDVLQCLPTEATVFRSLANSAAILAWPSTHLNYVRPGLMLFGSSPFSDKSAASFNLKPVMTVKSKIIAVHNFQESDAIGYGGTFVCQRPSRIAVVAFGYGDGYPRSVNNNSFVLIKNHRVPVVGRVSMDMLTVDVTDFPDIQQQDEVTLWGEGLPIDELAQAANTIPYEIFCRMPMHRMNVIIQSVPSHAFSAKSVS